MQNFNSFPRLGEKTSRDLGKRNLSTWNSKHGMQSSMNICQSVQLITRKYPYLHLRAKSQNIPFETSKLIIYCILLFGNWTCFNDSGNRPSPHPSPTFRALQASCGTPTCINALVIISTASRDCSRQRLRLRTLYLLPGSSNFLRYQTDEAFAGRRHCGP